MLKVFKYIDRDVLQPGPCTKFKEINGGTNAKEVLTVSQLQLFQLVFFGYYLDTHFIMNS